jgi:hypothetical protein
VSGVFRVFAKMAQTVVPTPRLSLNRLFDGILRTLREESQSDGPRRGWTISIFLIASYIATRQNEMKEYERNYINHRLLHVIQRSSNVVRALRTTDLTTASKRGDEIRASQAVIEAYLADLGYEVSKNMVLGDLNDVE